MHAYTYIHIICIVLHIYIHILYINTHMTERDVYVCIYVPVCTHIHTYSFMLIWYVVYFRIFEIFAHFIMNGI